jgi:hypothetical protein
VPTYPCHLSYQAQSCSLIQSWKQSSIRLSVAAIGKLEQKSFAKAVARLSSKGWKAEETSNGD